MSRRWCLWIDVEGFRANWDNSGSLRALACLMSGIFRIGARVYPRVPDRLFAHQFGDGFAVVSDHQEQSLERAIGIATALLRLLPPTGLYAKASIAEGDFSDIAGCYPPEIRQAGTDDGRLELGQGLMTITRVMGSAFIKAYGVGLRCSGPLLLIDPDCEDSVPSGLSSKHGQDGPLSIDWLHAHLPVADHISTVAGFPSFDPSTEDRRLLEFLKARHLSPNWREGALKHLRLSDLGTTGSENASQ